MAWYSMYREEKRYLDWYRSEFRKFASAFDDPEDACSTAIYRLLFEKLPNHEPRNSDNLDALVRVAFRNVVRDLVRERWGRPRPPSDMRRLGKPIEDIFFAFCLGGKPVATIAEELSLPEPSVRWWVSWLKAGERCPRRPVLTSLHGTDPDDSTGDAELPSDERHDPLGDDVQREEIGAIVEWLFDPGTAPAAGRARLGTALREKVLAMRGELSLSDEQRTLVRLRYLEELPATAVAEAIGIPVHTLRRREKALHEKLRAVLDAHGLEP